MTFQVKDVTKSVKDAVDGIQYFTVRCAPNCPLISDGPHELINLVYKLHCHLTSVFKTICVCVCVCVRMYVVVVVVRCAVSVFRYVVCELHFSLARSLALFQLVWCWMLCLV